MTSENRVAGIQMVSGSDLDTNLSQARQLLVAARDGGARVAVLPENFAVLHTAVMRHQGELEITSDGPIRSFLAEQARSLGLWLVGGSLPMASRADGSMIPSRVRATCWVLDDQGREVGRYDKIHLFDAEVGDAQGSYKESDTFEPGDAVVVVDTPIGRLGLSICYDLRFPELYRALAREGAQWVTVPSAFTYRTGEAHWEPLLRARAIENQVWVCAVDQGGQNSAKRRTWGHSMVVDPWGTVVARVEEGAQVVFADIDLAQEADLRRKMPVLQHRRLPG